MAACSTLLVLTAPATAAPATVPDFVMQPAPTPTANPWQVSGRVVFESKGRTAVPAAGIEVFLTSDGGRVVDRGRTGADGHYLLTAPRPGTYEVRVDQSAANRRRGVLLAPFKQIVTLK